MKKILLAAAVAALVSGTAAANQATGGGSYGAEGSVVAQGVAAGAVGLLVAGSVISNSRGSTIIIPDPEQPEVGCEGDDELNDDGFCVGTTTITTGTGTNTYTTTATFTYAPSVQ